MPHGAGGRWHCSDVITRAKALVLTSEQCQHPPCGTPNYALTYTYTPYTHEYQCETSTSGLHINSVEATLLNMAEENKDGGYDCDLIEEPPDDLICPICLLPPRKPHLISCCGRKLCHSCIDRVKQAGDPCPCCREEEYIIVKDKMVERQVLDLKVYCKNKSKGCPWSGELRDLEKHTAESCHASSAKLLAEKNEIIKKQAEDIKRLEEKNKEFVTMTKKMQNLLQTKIDHETDMKLSIWNLNAENEQLKQQLQEMEKNRSPSPSLDTYSPEYESLEDEDELEQFQLMHDRKNDVIEHQKEEIETLEEENRKLHDKVDGLSHQETAMKRSIETLNVENEQLKKQLRESPPNYSYYTPIIDPPLPLPRNTPTTVPLSAQQYDMGQCPVCQLAFPARTSQQAFQRHVNSHFGD